MKFVYPPIYQVFDTEEAVYSIIIENQTFLYQMLNDIQRQLDGEEGSCVVSLNHKVLPFGKNVELLTQFVPFTLNQKNLLSKVATKLEKIALDGLFYEKTMEMLSLWERYLNEISFELKADIDFSKLFIGSFIKAAGLEFCDEYTSLGEKIIDYMELVNEFDRDKLFILFNLRSFLTNQEMELFLDTVIRQGFHVLMIESSEHDLLTHEKRCIIDKNLCEII